MLQLRRPKVPSAHASTAKTYASTCDAYSGASWAVAHAAATWTHATASLVPLQSTIYNLSATASTTNLLYSDHLSTLGQDKCHCAGRKNELFARFGGRRQQSIGERAVRAEFQG